MDHDNVVSLRRQGPENWPIMASAADALASTSAARALAAARSTDERGQ